jgi:signal transduction histidine kinase
MLDANRLRIVVSDDGCGMQPRTDRTGLGLGLALIAQLSGHVVVTSEPRRGTTVAMEFLLLT